jgi:hypothetical protein
MGSRDLDAPAGTVEKAGDLIAESAELLRGLVTIVLRVIREALTPGTVDDALPDPVDEAAPGFLTLLPGAAIALAIEAQRKALQAAAAIDEQVGPVVRRVMKVHVISEPVEATRRILENLNVRSVKEQDHAVAAAQSMVERALPEVVRAVLDRIDLNEILDRVDMDRVLDRVDLDAVVSRISIDDILSRVDLDSVVAKVDIDGVVARIDVDAAVARVDIDAVIKRLDLARLTSDVITEVDLREIVRESSSSITGEAVDAVRVQGMNADRLVGRFMDRLLMRRSGRDLAGPVPPEGGDPLDGDAGRTPVPGD